MSKGRQITAGRHTFQIRKCGDDTCCSAPKRPAVELVGLPTPMLDRAHFITYESAKHLSETSEQDRPSLDATKEKMNHFQLLEQKRAKWTFKLLPPNLLTKELQVSKQSKSSACPHRQLELSSCAWNAEKRE